MKTFIEQVWKVEESYDRDSHIVARFSTKELAEEFKKASTNCHYLSVFKENIRIVIYESLTEVEEVKLQDIREKALEKLTSTERADLGL